MRRAVVIVGALVLAAGLGLGLWRVSALAGEEIDRFGDPVAAGELGTTPIVTGSLREGQRALFEVCAEDRFARGWGEVAFEIWHLGDGALAQRVEASRWQPRVQVSEQHACTVVLRWDSVLVEGEYGLRVDGAPRAAPDGLVRGRVAAWRDLGDGDLLAVLLSLGGTLLVIAGFGFRPRAPTGFHALAADALGAHRGRGPGLLDAARSKPAWLRITVAVALLVGAMVGLSVMQGTLLGLVRAMLLACLQLALAISLVAPNDETGAAPRREEALGLVRPRPGWWVLVLAPPVGLGSWLAGAWLSQLVPSTGLSAVEAFVARPSGALALGVVAVVVPVAEELFFRGFVYGAVESRHGPWSAIAVTTVVFAIAHLPQQWGAWGPFASVAATGLVLTLLRATTRSTFASAVAHLAHNAAITALALA